MTDELRCPDCNAVAVDHGEYVETAHEPGCPWMMNPDSQPYDERPTIIDLDVLCGTCGRRIVKGHRRWIDELGMTCCRTLIAGSRLLEADYHHAPGEPQEIWRLNGPPPLPPSTHKEESNDQ